jgi:hypothetical protein
MKRWPNILRLPLTQGDGDRRISIEPGSQLLRGGMVILISQNQLQTTTGL